MQWHCKRRWPGARTYGAWACCAACGGFLAAPLRQEGCRSVAEVRAAVLGSAVLI